MSVERVDELRQWRAQVVEELESSRRKLAELQKHIRETEQRLQLVDELITLEAPGDSPAPGRSKKMDLPADLLDECERLVMEGGQPIHIRELRSLLLERGIPIPGRGTEANLIVRLQRSDGRFVRVGRGLYAPRGLNLPEEKPTKRRRKARRSAGGGS